VSLPALPLIHLDWLPSGGDIIPASRLNEAYRLTSERKKADADAAAMMKAARREATRLIQRAESECRRIRMEARRDMAERQKRVTENSEARWLKRQVRQLTDHRTEEQLLVEEMSHRIRENIARVLEAWYLTQPLEQGLCEHLYHQISGLCAQQSLTLFIHPENAPAITARCGNTLRVVTDETMQTDEARLSSTRMQVTFSLSQYFSRLVDWLNDDVPEAEDEAQ